MGRFIRNEWRARRMNINAVTVIGKKENIPKTNETAAAHGAKSVSVSFVYFAAIQPVL